MLKNKHLIIFLFDSTDGKTSTMVGINVSPEGNLSYDSKLFKVTVANKEKGGFKHSPKDLVDKYKKMSSEDWYRYIYNNKQRCLKHRKFFDIMIN